MKSNAALDREIEIVTRKINDETGPLNVGKRGSKKYAVAFAIYHTLRWARGLREEYPSVELSKLPPDELAAGGVK